MLQALLDSVREILITDQVSDQVSDQVAVLIGKIGHQEFGANELMQALGLSHRPTFRNNYLNPALKDGWIERTSPKSHRSPTQKYRLSARGRRWFSERDEK